MEHLEEIFQEIRETKELVMELKKLISDKYTYRNSNELLTVPQVAHDLKLSNYYVRTRVLDEIEQITPGSVKRTGRHFKVVAKGLNRYKEQLRS